VVRELSKCLDGVSNGVLTMRVITFVMDTKDIGLKIVAKIDDEMNWKSKIFSDSDWVG
jgi:hypothetical protein